MKSKKQELKLIEVHGEELTTTSLIVAEEFGRRHDNVMRSIDRLLENGTISRPTSGPRDYIDSRGKTQKMYVYTTMRV
ncbi:MAG: Rha family transcriptional regulator [Burkholderiales bacterium]